MAQYCRFCSYCQINGYTGGPECEKKEKDLTEAQAKRTNKCKHYHLIECDDEVKDFFLETVYKPRKKYKKRIPEGQISLFEKEE